MKFINKQNYSDYSHSIGVERLKYSMEEPLTMKGNTGALLNANKVFKYL